MTADVTPRYCEADPFEGGKQAVAEAWRNITAVGGTPLAVTDNLNFGNPGAAGDHGPVRRLRARHRAKPAGRSTSRSCPAMSRSTTRPTAARSCRRRRSAASACWTISRSRRRIAFKAAGEHDPAGRRDAQAGSASRSTCATSADARRAPRRRSISRRRSATAISCAALIAEGIATAVHDVSDGGLAGRARRDGDGVGHRRDARRGCRHAPAHAFWFGEDQARYVVTVTAAQAPLVAERARKAGVAVRNLGATGGDALTLGAERPILVKTLAQKFEGWLPAYMAGPE